MYYLKKVALLGVGLFVLNGTAFGNLPFQKRWQDFSNDEQSKMLRGDVLLELKESDQGGWPQAGAWGVIPGVTPREVMAVFFDYEDQKNYLKRVDRVRIIEPEDKRPAIHTHVYYKLKPELGIAVDYAVKDSVSILRHTRDQRRNQYIMTWELSDLVQTRFVNAVSGYARLEALIGVEGDLIGTYITYYNWIIPPFTPPNVDRRQKASEIVDVIRGLRDRVAEIRTSPRLREKRQEQLRRLDAVPFQ